MERGAGAPLDEIARRAGVGIATLYRRFPDRRAPLRAVALDLWRAVADEAEAALEQEPDGLAALARYMHAALSLRIGAVMPAVTEEAWFEGSLRADVTFGDVGLLVTRLSRPLPGPFLTDLDDALAHRQLDVVLDGLRAPGRRPLGGPALEIGDLRARGRQR